MTIRKKAFLLSGAGALILASGALLLMTQTPSNAAVTAGNEKAATTTTAATRPVLVELFTSQGCSSCPPADAVLTDLSARGDVLPLAFHVDYWDYLGWVDPLASPVWTARQQQYARRRGFDVYTPQLVVDGRDALVGSNRGGVASRIAAAKDEAQGAVASLTRDGGDQVSLSIGAAPGADGSSAAGKVYLISFDERQTTTIRSGENGGRVITYANVVRSLRAVGDWRNEPLKIAEHLRPEERGERLALVVQSDSGEVWAVASTPGLQRAASSR